VERFRTPFKDSVVKPRMKSAAYSDQWREMSADADRVKPRPVTATSRKFGIFII